MNNTTINPAVSAGLRRLFASLLSTLACAAAMAADPPAQRPRAEQFFQAPVFSAAKLSPNGRLLAFRVADKASRARLAVLDLQTMKPNEVASFKDADVGSFQWVNDKRLVLDLGTELDGPGLIKMAPGLYAVNHDGTNFRQWVDTMGIIFAKDDRAGRVLPSNTFLYDSIGRQDSDDVMVVTPEEMGPKKVDYISLRRLNTVTGRVSDVDAPLHSFDWILDASGELRAAVTQQGNTEAIHYREADGTWRKLDEFDRFVGHGMAPRHIGPDGVLYVQASAGRDTTALYTYDPASRKLSERPVIASKDYDVDARFISNQHKVLGVRHVIDAEVTEWFDAGMKATQALVDARLPRTANRISVPTRPETSFVLVESFSDTQPSVFRLFNTQTQQFTMLGSMLTGIDARQLGTMDIVHYKARDGLTIPAYLTLPPGGANKNLPMVVLVHGGPWVRGTSWGWDPEVQFLASRGYAVLQPEYRGSTGFGGRHFRAGLKQWGLAMQDDIADGARWAIAEGIADARRICIAGASYGGYATLMGLVKDPDLFRCGIEWAGVTDIQLMYSVNWSDFSDEYKRYGMPKLVGDPVKDAAQLKATSPLENAARIRQPLLMAYGAYDVRVPIVHGEKFRDAVRAHNPQVEWVVYDNEGHGWAKPETRIDFWTRVEKFLERNLAAPAEGKASPQ